MKTIGAILKERSRAVIYRKAAEIFAVDYSLVARIASGKRKAIRGKSLEIKNWLEEQLNK